MNGTAARRPAAKCTLLVECQRVTVIFLVGLYTVSQAWFPPRATLKPVNPRKSWSIGRLRRTQHRQRPRALGMPRTMFLQRSAPEFNDAQCNWVRIHIAGHRDRSVEGGEGYGDGSVTGQGKRL